MHVALIATYTHPIALGMRYVSAYLKAHGKTVSCYFMRSRRDTAEADFSPALLDELVERLRPADVIGMSLMTNTFHRACVLTETIRKAGIRSPIVWGGTHPTVAPDESIEVADIVCVGEGEHALLELVEQLESGKDPTSIESLLFRRNGKVERNPVRRLHVELDAYPFPDYQLETHWVAAGNSFEMASPRNLRGALHRLRIETTRGCPYPCTFCNNAALLQVYRGKGSWVRKRSAESVVAEIEEARRHFPTIEAVNIVDDLFFVRSEEEIEEFTELYRRRVNLPIELDAFPNTITRRKVQTLAKLPISLISMGIQSGSVDTLKNIYKRPTPIDKIVEGINSFADHKLRAEYHYIVNNPFESDANRIETMRFAATHHRGPAILRIFPLQFYPGTPLYDRARAEGLIGQRHESAYEYTYTGKTHLLQSKYLDIWLRVILNLRNIGVPSSALHRLIDVIIHPRVRSVLDKSWFPSFAFGSYRVGRFVLRKMIYQPLIRPLRYFKRRPRYEELHPEDEATLPRNPMPQKAARSQRAAAA